jgi:arylsulfatase A-like enzyme
MPARTLCLATACLFLLAGHAEAADKPNIVLLYIDDWAWNGTPVAMDDAMKNSAMPVLKMPNVERLAKDGMKFTCAYGSPQCSPARASILTGQSSPHNGFTVFMNNKGQDYFDAKSFKVYPVVPCVSASQVDKNALTIPKALQPMGYVSAHFGKWHLRSDPGEAGYATHDGATENKEGNTLGEDGQRIPATLTDPKKMFSVTERAVAFMEQQVKAGKPFYVQISHYAMHEGRECLPATREKYAKDPLVQAYYQKAGKKAETINRKHDPAVWLGMGEDLDGRIGAVLDKLKKLGVADNTYVVLTADNGYRHSFLPGLTQPLHAAKWWLWDGGIRVPMIATGPGIKAGSVFTANVANYDFLPTFFEWAGGDPKQLKTIDGVSLASAMAGKKPTDEFVNRNLYFHYPHYRTSMPQSAVISGSRKVIHFYDRPDLPILFDLTKDPGETTNIAASDADEHKKLYAGMMDYFKRVDAKIPRANPDADPKVYQKDPAYQERLRWGPFEGRRALEADEK